MSDDAILARLALSRFTPENPMWVGKNVMKALQGKSEIADLMDRVRVYETIPVGK